MLVIYIIAAGYKKFVNKPVSRMIPLKSYEYVY